MKLLSKELLSQFVASIEGNPYISVSEIDPYRMELTFLDLTGLAMLCWATEAANIGQNICFTPGSCRNANFGDFRSYVSDLPADQQAVYLISLCWALRDLGWNVDAVNLCENALQQAYIALCPPESDEPSL